MNVPTFVGNIGGKISRLAIQHGPSVLLYAGVAGVVAGTVMACRATFKYKEVAEKHQEVFAKIEQVKQTADPAEYTEDDYRRDRALAVVQRAINIGKLYAPAAGVIALSLAAILTSHKMMSNRQFALIAAYNALQEGYDKYRGRVIAEYGEQKDADYRFGQPKAESVVVEDEKGVISENIVERRPEFEPGQFHAYFDEKTSAQYRRLPSLNKFTLEQIENEMNRILNIRGHLFYNEVLDRLGIERTIDGQIFGWVRDNPNGDGYVDFGLHKPFNVDFMQGKDPVALLDFNVDKGTILDIFRKY